MSDTSVDHPFAAVAERGRPAEPHNRHSPLWGRPAYLAAAAYTDKPFRRPSDRNRSIGISCSRARARD